MRGLGVRRALVWGGIGLVVLVLLGWALAPRPVPSDLALVERGALTVTLDEEGETRVRDRFVVSAPLSGRVLRIELEPGDTVRAGDTVLATFRPNDPQLLDARSRREAQARVRAAEAALDQARAERQRAQAELDYAVAELERAQRLAEERILSREGLDQAELAQRTRKEALEAADSAVRSARFELERARAALYETGEGSAGRTISIRSPIDGVVLRRLRESEAVVPAGEPLVEVGDPAKLEVVADYLSNDAVKIRPGLPVQITQWGGERALGGRVRRVEPAGFTKISALGVEEQRVNVIVDFDEPQEAWAALGDGYRVEVQVVIWHDDDVLKVPMAGVFRHGASWATYVVDGRHARLREVQLGQRNGLEARVAEGLEEGQRVILHPSDQIEDGVAVIERGS